MARNNRRHRSRCSSGVSFFGKKFVEMRSAAQKVFVLDSDWWRAFSGTVYRLSKNQNANWGTYLEAMLPNNFCPSVRRPFFPVQICTTIVCLSHRTRSELETFGTSSSLRVRCEPRRGQRRRPATARQGLQVANEVGGTANAVVAVGPQAASALQKSEARGVVCMVPRVEAYALDPDRVAAIRLEASYADQLATLAALYPTRTRVGVVFDPGASSETLERLRSASAGAKIVGIPVRTPEEVEGALAILDVDALLLIADPVALHVVALEAQRKFAQAKRVPIAAPAASFVEQGATFALVVDWLDVGAQAASVADRIDAGTAPRAIGVLSPGGRRSRFASTLARSEDRALCAAARVCRRERSARALCALMREAAPDASRGALQRQQRQRAPRRARRDRCPR